MLSQVSYATSYLPAILSTTESVSCYTDLWSSGDRLALSTEPAEAKMKIDIYDFIVAELKLFPQINQPTINISATSPFFTVVFPEDTPAEIRKAFIGHLAYLAGRMQVERVARRREMVQEELDRCIKTLEAERDPRRKQMLTDYLNSVRASVM